MVAALQHSLCQQIEINRILGENRHSGFFYSSFFPNLFVVISIFFFLVCVVLATRLHYFAHKKFPSYFCKCVFEHMTVIAGKQAAVLTSSCFRTLPCAFLCVCGARVYYCIYFDIMCTHRNAKHMYLFMFCHMFCGFSTSSDSL